MIGHSVCFLSFDAEGRVLMIMGEATGWGLPAGKVKPGESLATAVVREVIRERNAFGLPSGYATLFEANNDPMTTRSELNRLCVAATKAIQAEVFIRFANRFEELRPSVRKDDGRIDDFDDWMLALADELDAELVERKWRKRG